MIRQLIDRIRAQLEEWHRAGLDLFPIDEAGWSVSADSLEGQVFRLVYHNYENWHTEEIVQTIADDTVAMRHYRRGIGHNRDRNLAMEKIDQIVAGMQRGGGEPHSETLGSILDRLTILHLKLLHSQDTAPERVADLRHQEEFLARCACSLYEDLLAGRRQCTWYVRKKLFN
jgi:hypothetical protein